MRRRRISIVLILFVMAVLLNLPLPAEMAVRQAVGENVAPFQNVMSLAVHHAVRVLALVRRASETDEDIRRLEEEIAALRMELRRREADSSDAAELRQLAGFVRQSASRMALCQVIARGEISGWWQTVRLNRGRRDGLDTDLAVVTADGLIGKTISVAEHSSEVLLITDPNCRVSSRVPATRGFGIVQGAGPLREGVAGLELLYAPGMLRLQFAARDLPLRQGLEVVTSGLGGVYPEGLLVGHVVTAGIDPSGLYQQADILPAARLDELRHVFVILKDGGRQP